MDVPNLNAKLNKLIQEKGHLIPKKKQTDIELSSKWQAEINASNTCGSTAGAGSGDFHLFKNQRRNEMFRLKEMYDQTEKEILDREWEEKKRSREEAETAKAERNRKKRLKRKQNKKDKPNEEKSNDAEASDSDSDNNPENTPTPAATTTSTAETPKPVDEEKPLEKIPSFISETNQQWNWTRIAVSVRADVHMTQLTNISAALQGYDATLHIDVAAPSAKTNLVNKELISFLAHTFGTGKSNVTVLSGHHDLQKSIQVQDCSAPFIVRKLESVKS